MPKHSNIKTKPKHVQTPAEQLAMLRAWNAAVGGKEVISG
jgi:hypothetical protein